MKLIQNIDVYAPQHLGKKDVLTINDKIVKIADAGTISAGGILADATVVDGSSLILTPGFIDSHVHVLGGGGEGGFANRTPEATLEGLTKFGVTTVVGCLGTDGIGRDMCSLVAKTKGLNEQGMSAYCYTGSYQIPVHTLTDSITKDIMMIQEIIGTGEIAISDHRYAFLSTWRPKIHRKPSANRTRKLPKTHKHPHSENRYIPKIPVISIVES